MKVFAILCTLLMTALYGDYRELDEIAQQAIAEGAFPGGVLLLAQGEKILYAKAFGTLSYEGAVPVSLDTLYDLASLTKVIATAPAILKLCEEGRITLDDRLFWYFPEIDNPEYEKITIRQLLQHTSGLASDVPSHWFKDRDFLALSHSEKQKKIWDYIFKDSLICTPRAAALYSDLGFMLLGKIVEKVTGLSLEAYVQKTFFVPLNMNRTAFLPLDKGFSLGEIAPTEVDVLFRKRVIHGTVHDEKADLMEGVSGHAGLFSTARDLLRFLQMILFNGTKDGISIFKPEIARQLYQFPQSDSLYALGMERMPLFAEQGFGHFGFTGTAFWVDPQTQRILILLTNRVHPTRDNIKIRAVRRHLVEVVNSLTAVW